VLVSLSRRRLDDDEDEVSGLEETEYEYEVAHTLSLEVSLNIVAPGAGFAQIDLQIPGIIKGTFLSNEHESDLLTDVIIELNTDILASMIEKSSRTIVRSSVQSMLERDDDHGEESEEHEQEDKLIVEKATAPLVLTTVTPKKHAQNSSPVFVTPRETLSPALASGRDKEDSPLLLSIPDNLTRGEGKRSLRLLTPQASRARATSGFSLHQRPYSKQRELPQLVTPLNQEKPSIVGKGVGPNLPVLVAACAAMNSP
jgi:hypothetical protein